MPQHVKIDSTAGWARWRVQVGGHDLSDSVTAASFHMRAGGPPIVVLELKTPLAELDFTGCDVAGVGDAAAAGRAVAKLFALREARTWRFRRQVRREWKDFRALKEAA